MPRVFIYIVSLKLALLRSFTSSLPTKTTVDLKIWEAQLLIWAPYPLSASYPGIPPLCRVHFEPRGNYIEGHSQAQETNRHFTVALFPGGPPNICQIFTYMRFMELCVTRGTELLWTPHCHTASQWQNPCRIKIPPPFSFSLNPPPAQVSVLPRDYVFLLSLPASAPQKICFVLLFSHIAAVENHGAFVKRVVYFHP